MISLNAYRPSIQDSPAATHATAADDVDSPEPAHVALPAEHQSVEDLNLQPQNVPFQNTAQRASGSAWSSQHPADPRLSIAAMINAADPDPSDIIKHIPC